MYSTAVSLESLQYLLQHMDANRRFEISNRCPALRTIERSIPLKINFLALTKRFVIVNDTTYKLGIIRRYNVGEAPDYVTASNERGGVDCEVDKYGIRDELDAYTMTPGDVGIEQHGEPWIPSDDLAIGSLENRIQRYEVQLAQEQERRLNRNRETVARIETAIQIARAKIFAYQCRRENIPPNYKNFLQLTKSRKVDKQEIRTVERYAHNKKFSETMKQLTTVLFEGRSSPIYVTRIEVCFGLGVIRLPIGLKFHIQQLGSLESVGPTLEALAPIIHESSFPLKKLDINLSSVDDIANPILQAAATLSITVVLPDILQTVAAITNPVVCIRMITLTEQTLERLIGNWIDSKRPIGMEHTISLFHKEPGFADEMEDILKRLNGVPIDDENVIIPMSDATQLKISYGPFPEFAPRLKWAVKFSTVAIEH